MQTLQTQLIAIQVSGPWKKWDPDLPIAVSFVKSFPQENVHGLEFKPLKFFTKAQKCSSNRPFIHDTRNLCTRLRTDRIKMSRGFSGGKQVIKCANARNRGRVCIFQPTENEELFILRTINGKLWVEIIIVTFLDAVRENKQLDRDYSYQQILSLVCSLKYHVTLLS